MQSDNKTAHTCFVKALEQAVFLAACDSAVVHLQVWKADWSLVVRTVDNAMFPIPGHFCHCDHVTNRPSWPEGRPLCC